MIFWKGVVKQVNMGNEEQFIKSKELEEMEEVVKHLEFVFAKSMPKIPHYYTVKNDENKVYYEKLFHYIQDKGYWQKFFKTYYRYANIGPYKYWIMADKIEDSRIINRRLINE